MPPFIPRKRPRSPSPLQSTPNETKKPSPKKLTIFDTLDAKPSASNTVQDNKAFLETLNGDSDSSLSDISSSDFEDVGPTQPFPKRRRIEEDDNEDDEIDWEDAMEMDASIPTTPAAPLSGDLEITLDKGARLGSLTNPHSKKKGPSRKEREIRVVTHCMHVQYLMFHNLARNAWVCDDEVQKILVAQLPLGVKKEVEKWRMASGMPAVNPEEAPRVNGKAKGKLTASRRASKPRNQRDWGGRAERQEEGIPNMSRSDPLIRLLKILAAYWKKRFTATAPGLRKQGYKSLARLETEIASFRNDSHTVEEHGERISDLAHFRDHARKCEGSRDVGAQLFTALIRGVGLEARMVASLQPIGFGWSKNEEAAAKRRKGNNEIDGSGNASSDSDMRLDDSGVVVQKRNGSAAGTPSKTPSVRKRKPKGGKDAPIDLSEGSDGPSSLSDEDDDSVLDITPSIPRKIPVKPFDKDLPFPVYWTEVASPITNDIIPVDPLILTPSVATNAELLSSFEPRGGKAEKAKQVLAYVVAFSPDGTAKDVTTRYLKRHMWPGKTKGMRLPVEKVPIYNKRGKVKRYEDYDWFRSVISGYERSHSMRTVVDDLEDSKDLKPVKPEKKVVKEGGETLQGYKNSAEFVLERHLRREEAILPAAKHVRMFTTGKGDGLKEEKVFRREDVMVCRTGESWHKEGRQVKPGEYPMKMVPVRAVTLTRKREVEEAERDSGKKLKQGLYAWDQTEWIIPPPIKDGLIPKNAFGNIDCYVPTMVPEGAVHIPRKGTMRVCKKLGIDFAEAVTGFEFGKQRAVPVITGVVVATEYEKLVIDAWKLDEEERRKKEEGKREKVALATWRKFLMGLRIVERVREEYGGDADAHMKEDMNPFTNQKKKKQRSSDKGSEQQPVRDDDGVESEHQEMGGGFLPEDYQDEMDGGGFLPGPDGSKEAPLGFIIDDEESSAKDKSPMHKISTKIPQSLQSAHRESPAKHSPSDTEEDPPPAAPSAPPKSHAKQKPQKPGNKTTKPQQKPRRAPKQATKPTKTTTPKPKQMPHTQPSDTESTSSALSSPQSSSGNESLPETSIPQSSQKPNRKILKPHPTPPSTFKNAKLRISS